MNVHVIGGVAALAYGLVTLVVRFTSPASPLLSKLEPMRQRWGRSTGTAVHWATYTGAPLIVGTVALARGLGFVAAN